MECPPTKKSPRTRISFAAIVETLAAAATATVAVATTCEIVVSISSNDPVARCARPGLKRSKRSSRAARKKTMNLLCRHCHIVAASLIARCQSLRSRTAEADSRSRPPASFATDARAHARQGRNFVKTLDTYSTSRDQKSRRNFTSSFLARANLHRLSPLIARSDRLKELLT